MVWQAWVCKVQTERRHQSVLARTLGKMRNRAAAAAWAEWLEFLDMQQKARRVLRTLKVGRGWKSWNGQWQQRRRPCLHCR